MAQNDLRFQALEEPEQDRTSAGRRRRVLTFAAAGLVTLGGLGVALVLGTYGYDIRRTNMHDTRLRRVLAKTPTVYQITEGLKEMAPLAMIVDSPGELQIAIDRLGADKAVEIRTKAASWPHVRVFDAGDMWYFIFFDDAQIMRDYVFVTHHAGGEVP